MNTEILSSRKRMHRTSLVVAITVWGCALALGVGVGYATDRHDVAASEARDGSESHPAITTTSTTVELPQEVTPVAPVEPQETPVPTTTSGTPGMVTEAPAEAPLSTTVPADSPPAPTTTTVPPSTTTSAPTTSIPEPPNCPPGSVAEGPFCYPAPEETP